MYPAGPAAGRNALRPAFSVTDITDKPEAMPELLR
jgi:hypothetical protein